jgi:hypothetical protein
MAALALNTYKTFRKEVTTGITTVYTAPSGVSSIHLFSVVSNTSAGIATVTVLHNRAAGEDAGPYELIKDAKIPATDALNPISGSLVLEVGDQIQVQGSANSVMKFTLSILESAK